MCREKKGKQIMKNALRILALMLVAVFSMAPLQAQKLIKKELQTENNEEDGFQYQWNRYTYVQGKDTLDAAFDLNNKRITPNGYRKYEKGKVYQGVRYVGGGRFQVYSKNMDAFGNKLISGYNVKGECVLPETVYTYMNYLGSGLFGLYSRDDLGKSIGGLYDNKGNCIISETRRYDYFGKEGNYIECHSADVECEQMKCAKIALCDRYGNCIIPETKGFNYFHIEDGFIECKKLSEDFDIEAVYDLQGNCIISEDLGYTWIAYYPKYEFFWCDKGEIECTISKDGQYYAEGEHYSNYDRDEFERKKRRVPNWSRNNNSKTTSSSGSSNSSISKATSTAADDGLLYQGEYTVSEDVGSLMEIFSIYEDRLSNGTVSFAYNSTNSNGERIYSGDGLFGVFWKFFVSPNYNIRLTKVYPNPYGMPTTVNCRVTKGQSSMPVQNGGGYYGGSGDYNGTTGGNSGTSGNPVQPHQVTKDCPLCHGSGKCNSCNGTHRINYQFGAGTLECPNCKPDGRCTHCGGSGKVTQTKYY